MQRNKFVQYLTQGFEIKNNPEFIKNNLINFLTKQDISATQLGDEIRIDKYNMDVIIIHLYDDKILFRQTEYTEDFMFPVSNILLKILSFLEISDRKPMKKEVKKKVEIADDEFDYI